MTYLKGKYTTSLSSHADAAYTEESSTLISVWLAVGYSLIQTWFESKSEGRCFSFRLKEWKHKKGQKWEVQAANPWDSDDDLVNTYVKKMQVCITVPWVCRDINHAFFLSLYALNHSVLVQH